jgi:hypothetical protein
MKIEANDKEVQEVLSLGYFKIPRFQRPYSWGDEEIKNFWMDVVKEEHEQYFIGSMVVYQTKKPYFGVVDGQQRLTTITLLLAAIRNAFIQLEEKNLAHGVHNYVERANIDNENEFILNSETSYPYLQDSIQSFSGNQINHDVKTEEQNLKHAFEYITSSLENELPHLSTKTSQPTLFSDPKEESLQRLKEIRDKVLSLKLVFIQLDNEEDAYLIFETLNARGQDLTTSDLIKNLLLKVKKTKNPTLDTAKIIWNKIVKKFDDAGILNGMDSFLYHYWLSCQNNTTDKKLFNEVKMYVNNVESADTLLDDLQSNSDYYLSIISPSEYNWSKEETEVQKSLEALLLFNVKQQSSMVLSLMRAYRMKKITLKILRQTLEKIEHFHYAFNTITQQRSSGSIASHYSKYAILLTNAERHDDIQSVISSLLEGLKYRFPTYNEFKTGFENLTYTSMKSRNKNLIKYTLGKLLGNSSNGLSIDFTAMTLEHIMPEEQFKFGYFEEDIGKIGNLILVDRKTNNEELANLPFKEKMLLLNQKKYPLDTYVLSQDLWGKEQIDERTKLCIDEIYKKIMI